MTTQKDLIFEYYESHPDRDIEHPEVVDWATAEYMGRTGKVLRDPDRAIRLLYSESKLIKVRNGVYRYNPDWAESGLDDVFTSSQKDEIMRLGGYRCAVCGITKEEGADLQVDHIRPRSMGGRSNIENGQVLCGPHNYRKKNYGQTETGKRMFINLRNLAVKEKDKDLMDFVDHVLEVYEEHSINSHIEWEA